MSPRRASAGPEARERPQARGARRVVDMNPSQADGQRQEPQRVPGRGGVEEDVVEVRRRPRRRRAAGRTRRRRRSPGCRSRRTAPPCSPPRRRAARPGTGPTIRSRYALGRRLRVDVHRRQVRHARDRRWASLPSVDAEHLVEVRRRVGADEQHPLARRRPGATAVAQATEVLPTPPLPVKNRLRVGWSRNSMTHLRALSVSSSRSGRSTTRPARSRPAASAATRRTSAASICAGRVDALD